MTEITYRDTVIGGGRVITVYVGEVQIAGPVKVVA